MQSSQTHQQLREKQLNLEFVWKKEKLQKIRESQQKYEKFIDEAVVVFQWKNCYY